MDIKMQTQTTPQPRRLPLPEWNADKGRKHEAFEGAFVGGDRRSQARAISLDRKR